MKEYTMEELGELNDHDLFILHLKLMVMYVQGEMKHKQIVKDRLEHESDQRGKQLDELASIRFSLARIAAALELMGEED